MSTDGPVWRAVAECPEPSIACEVARIADSMSGFDWNAFWATLLATIVGAVVAAFIGLYVARIEKPQPYFRIDSAVPDEWETFDRKAVVRVTVSNIGDGAAYDVSFTVSGGLSAEETVRAARLESGASLSTSATLKMTGRQTMHPDTLVMLDGRKVHWPDHGLHASVKWHQPRRRRARLLTLPVTNPFAQTKRDHAAKVWSRRSGGRGFGCPALRPEAVLVHGALRQVQPEVLQQHVLPNDAGPLPVDDRP